MRGLDLGPVRAALASRAENTRLDAARFRRAERWRDLLVDGGDAALAEFGAEFAVDRAQLARLAGDARRERDTGRPAGAARRLFRFVQEALGARE